MTHANTTSYNCVERFKCDELSVHIGDRKVNVVDDPIRRLHREALFVTCHGKISVKSQVVSRRRVRILSSYYLYEKLYTRA